MTSITTIGFDADDTLWESEIYYHNAKRKFTELLADYAPAELLITRLDETEVHNVQLYGYGVKSFVLSMVEAAIQITQGRVRAAEIDAILGFGRQMLEGEIEKIGAVEPLLAGLMEGYRLLLITKGELFEQGRKIERSGLAPYFSHIQVLNEKTPEAYRKLLSEQKIPAEQFLMVGNSLRSDVLPVLAIGGWAVLVPHPLTWAHEANPGIQTPDGRWFEIPSLNDLHALVQRLVK